eukprot:Phypoly_transcript_01804.p1 GENE.Phypoly_transcript_01804~~Phypoly_transcript_01804.p1  ORF type:complete len:912 (-),score=138.37 Phypoly_transcript_01804:33-2768(-)
MHYENGHEVAQQLAREVHSIAFSPAKAWVRTESTEETYICQLGGMIALKLHAIFECSPDTLLSILQERQMEWDINLRHLEILEEYDHFNQIKLQKFLWPVVGKMVNMCLYTCVIANQPNQYAVVYQSIDHERIPPYEPLINIFPSGFFLAPVPGSPHRCHLTSVFQFQSEYPQNPKVVAHFCSSSERIIAGLRGVVSRSSGMADRWESIVNFLRKDMYHTMQTLNPSDGWALRFQRAGMRTYTRQNSQEFRVATRTSFTLPYRCHEVASYLFAASYKNAEWDHFVEKTEDTKFLGPNTVTQRITYSDLQDGTAMKGYMLVHMNIIKDNTCDIFFKVSYNEPPVSFNGWLHNFITMGGFIIHTSPDNPRHCTIQSIVDTPHSAPCSDEGLKRESLRVHHYLTSLVVYITKIMQQNLGNEPPATPPPLMELPRETPYATAIDTFSKTAPAEASIFKGPPESPRSTREPAHRAPYSKRKQLMNVDDVVFSSNPRNMAPPVTPRKPFLFLVSDDGSAHRFLRRRLESPIVHSKFDALPQELILEVFKLLDSSALNSIARTCTYFKEFVSNCQLWRTLYHSVWGEVRGRVARRYCGDDDPATFFATFPDWKELYLEKQYIEAAWDAPERRALSFTVTKAHARSVQSMALLPYRHRLVTGSQDRLVRVWDVTSGACLLKLHGTASCVAVSPWSDALVKVGYKDGSVHVFDVVREESTSEMRTGEPMRGCIFANNSIISWYEQDVIHWDETTSQRVATFTGHLQRVKACAYSSSKSILYTASRDTTVRLWDLHNRSKIGTIDGHTRSVNTVALIGENLCLTGSSDKLVKVWDIRKMDTAVTVLSVHTGKLTCIKHSEVGSKLCTGGADGVHLWNSTNFTHVRKDFEGEFVTSLALDEESIAYGGLNGQIQYYDFSPHR